MRTVGLGAALGVICVIGACAGGEDANDNNNTGGGGTGATTTGGGGTGATGGAAGTAGSGGSAGVATGGGGAPTGGGGGPTGGSGGTDAALDSPVEAGWPSCDVTPAGVPVKTLLQIWADDSSVETQVWVPGVYVTAVSGGACVAGQSCQIFVQQDLTYPSLLSGAKHGIKLRISGPTAQYFTGIAPGDRIDVLGWAWRYDLGGSNEMVIQVNAILPGCAHEVGSGSPTPIAVQLSDLTVNAYEVTVGPLLVRLSAVTGKPALPNEIFGLWSTGVGIGDAGPAALVNASPFFLAGGAFSGLTSGQNVSFQTLSGVFSVFVPATDGGAVPKYKVMYPRTMADLVQ